MEASAERQKAAVATMTASLDKQRAAVKLQAERARQVEPGAAAHSFFAVPWPSPVAMVQPDCDPIPPERIREYVEQAAKREGLTPDLIRAVIDRESAFQPCAVSSKGAQGLMQLMPATADMLRVDDPFDPQQNIDGGSRLLRLLLDRYSGDLALALGAYNAGAGAVGRYAGLPPFPETLNYVSDILRALKK